MELFSEIYSSYFRAVENMLRLAEVSPLTAGEIQKVLSEGTFSESAFHILPKLQSRQWPLLKKTGDGYSTEYSLPEKNPLTSLQMAWLRSILDDPRISLFLDDEERDSLLSVLGGVEPLFKQEDFYLFDSASDGDDYANKDYRDVFRAFLMAVRQKTALSVSYEGGKGSRVNGVFWPYKLEYSKKDDKFRAHCLRGAGFKKTHCILNMGRVTCAMEPDCAMEFQPTAAADGSNGKSREVVIEITHERNALERCMVHFAHFEKRTEYDEQTGRYICTICYNAMDETEVVIRVLSFGPTIRVLGPDVLLEEIRNRVRLQAKLNENTRRTQTKILQKY